MSTHLAGRNLILERLRDLHESLDSRPPESKLATAPKALKTTLMPHQLHALAWLRWRETQRPCGGILADDMGLGKTITMISLVLGDKEGDIEEDDDDEEPGKGKSKVVRGGTLVVCPASLMQQWGGEVRRHCAPHALTVVQHHGAGRATMPHRLAAADLVLTTYNILQRDHDKNGVVMRVQWRRVVLDEAHAVRNHKSATCGAVRALPARRRSPARPCTTATWTCSRSSCSCGSRPSTACRYATPPRSPPHRATVTQCDVLASPQSSATFEAGRNKNKKT
ncbi:hypothetical protein ACJJTC_009085 [Scirpophaga incertulas]